MDLSEKIKQILVQKNISPSLFADEIGIQRSSMSHILAGRNKPSLDIVQKIIKRFPDLGVNWILDEEDMPALSAETEAYKPRSRAVVSHDRSHSSTASELNRKKYSHHNAAQEILRPINKSQNEGKTAERILIFYTDGTFQEFKMNN